MGTISSVTSQVMLAPVLTPAEEDAQLLKHCASERPIANVDASSAALRSPGVPELLDAETIAACRLSHMSAVPWCEVCINSRGRDAMDEDTLRVSVVILALCWTRCRGHRQSRK